MNVEYDGDLKDWQGKGFTPRNLSPRLGLSADLIHFAQSKWNTPDRLDIVKAIAYNFHWEPCRDFLLNKAEGLVEELLANYLESRDEKFISVLIVLAECGIGHNAIWSRLSPRSMKPNHWQALKRILRIPPSSLDIAEALAQIGYDEVLEEGPLDRLKPEVLQYYLDILTDSEFLELQSILHVDLNKDILAVWALPETLPPPLYAPEPPNPPPRFYDGTSLWQWHFEWIKDLHERRNGNENNNDDNDDGNDNNDNNDEHDEYRCDYGTYSTRVLIDEWQRLSGTPVLEQFTGLWTSTNRSKPVFTNERTLVITSRGISQFFIRTGEALEKPEDVLHRLKTSAASGLGEIFTQSASASAVAFKWQNNTKGLQLSRLLEPMDILNDREIERYFAREASSLTFLNAETAISLRPKGYEAVLWDAQAGPEVRIAAILAIASASASATVDTTTTRASAEARANESHFTLQSGLWDGSLIGTVPLPADQLALASHAQDGVWSWAVISN